MPVGWSDCGKKVGVDRFLLRQNGQVIINSGLNDMARFKRKFQVFVVVRRSFFRCLVMEFYKIPQTK